MYRNLCAVRLKNLVNNRKSQTCTHSEAGLKGLKYFFQQRLFNAGASVRKRDSLIVFSVIKHSDVYREAYTRAANDPRVVAALGTPIEKGWWVMGKVSVDNNEGVANIDFPISGPKGSARVHAAASRGTDAWNYSSLVVRPAAGGEIDVLHQ